MDDAYELAVRRLGEDRALPLFDGTALGLAAVEPAAPLAVPPSGRTGSARASV
jgi:hypothetical protein